jgi:TetR/AcrR family transcriptional repressor of nem operon
MSRPKEFDRQEVLDRAIDAFWKRGYEATSVQDLVDSMGINRGSIYATFGDKHQLFLEALDRYEEVFHTKMLEALHGSKSPRKGIERVFDTVIRECACDSGKRGCLLTNTAVELSGHDEETAQKVQLNMARLEAAFEQSLSSAKQQGEISNRRNTKALARFLTSTLQGLRVMSKVRPDRSALRDVVEVTISALD